MTGECTLCGEHSEEIVHLPLYVIGSEGVWVCIDCRIALTEVAKRLRERCGAVRGSMYKKAKKSRTEYEKR